MKSRVFIALLVALSAFVAGVLSVSVAPTNEHGEAISPTVKTAPVSDPVDALGRARARLGALGDRRTLSDIVRFGDALEGLTATEFAELLAIIERNDGAGPTDRMACVMKLWLKRDGNAASAWAAQRLAKLAQDGPLGITFSYNGIGQLTRLWARERPEDALALARKFPRSGLALALLTEVDAALSTEGVEARLARIRDFPEGKPRTAMLIQVIGAWGRKAPQAALDAAKDFPAGSDREKAIGAVLKSWPKKDAAAAFEHYREAGLSDTETLRVILKNGAFQDAETGKQWMAVLNAEQFAEHAPEFVALWAKRDPAAALSWAAENGVALSYHWSNQNRISHNGIGSRSSSFGGNATYAESPMAEALLANPEKTLDWIRALPDGQRNKYTHIALIASRTSDMALSLYEGLPPDARASASGIVASRFGSDIAKGRAWIETLPAGLVRENAWTALARNLPEPFDLPPGPDRDAMLAGNMFRSGTVDHERSLGLILKIDNRESKRDALEAGMEYFTGGFFGGSYAEKARAWLEKADLPEDWKRPWLGEKRK